MLRRSIILPLLMILSVPPGTLGAQARFFGAGLAGAGFSLNRVGPGTGGGFGYQGAAGVALRRLSIGGEAGEYSLGYDRKARVFGGFLRLSSPSAGPFQPYLALGLGAYRYSPASSGSATSLGGSIGPGARVRIGRSRASLLLEARIHTNFDSEAQVSTQEFVTAMAGLQIGL